MLRFTEILLGDGEAALCRHCHPKRPPSLRDASSILADVHSTAETWNARPGPNVSLTGAEPFNHPDLGSILSACTEAGVQRVRLDSECSALSSADVTRDALAAGVRQVRFTLLGPDARTHDALLGRPGAFDATVLGAASFRAGAARAGVAVQVSAFVPVCRHNIADMPGVVARAAEAGASSVLARVTDPRLELPAATPWISTACDTGLLSAVWVEVEGVPVCHAAEWHLHLASNYRKVAGAKSDACAACPLDDVCGGAAPGAGSAVTSVLRPPVDAEHLAARIRHGLAPEVVARG